MAYAFSQFHTIYPPFMFIVTSHNLIPSFYVVLIIQVVCRCPANATILTLNPLVIVFTPGKDIFFVAAALMNVAVHTN
jgi:hypothetical protein